jgi:hypothetical protein
MTRSRAYNEAAWFTPADRERVVSQIAPCPTCGGALRFDTNGAGSHIEICDRCADRARAARRNHSPRETSMATTAAPRAALLPPPVVGKPCPHCGQKVKPERLCKKCGTNKAPFGKQLCTACRQTKPRVRFCNLCGERFELLGKGSGEKNRGTAWAYCPKHRKRKAA